MPTVLVTMLLATGLVPPDLAGPLSREDLLLLDATAVLQEIQAVPDRGIPVGLIREARGLIIIPGMKKAGFVLSGHVGRGITVVRQADGSWSQPIFVRLVGAGLGAQIGVEAQDLILVLRTDRSMRWLHDGKEITLSASMGAAAGPVGRDVKAGTNLRLDAEILSYSRSRGLFAGVAVSSGRLRVDQDALATYYRQPGLSSRDLLMGRTFAVPSSAVRFAQVLAEVSQAPPVEVGPPPGPTPPQ